MLVIVMSSVSQATGLFKLKVSGIRNSASLMPSSPFGQIFQQTKENRKTSEFKSQYTVTNAYAAALQGLSSDNIKQGSNEYNEVNTYTVTFTPYSTSKANPMSILLSYPATVNPTANSANCIVKAGSTSTTVDDCAKIENARLFKIANAIPANHTGPVTIAVELQNPADNWGTVGVKIKTYEVKDGNEYLADILEGNQLIPLLKCIAPCKECQDVSKGPFVDKNYCTECWMNYPQQYLQTKVPWDGKKGTATC